MIMINGNWEQVKDLSDILRIVSENIGDEFSKKVEEICREPSEELYAAYQKLEYEKDELEQKCDDISESLDYLNEQIDKLESYIDENKDGTDFMEGMIKAYNMIKR